VKAGSAIASGAEMRPSQKVGLLAVAGFLTVAAFASVGFAFGSGTPLGAQPNAAGGCPDSNAIGNFVASSLVSASISNSSSTSSYYFNSLSDLSPSNGVPGLIAYCVYTASPTSTSVSAVGDDGSAWQTASSTHGGYFAFERSTGNPSNIGLDGTTGILMGSASWSSGLPSTQTVLLHINDATECQNLYGGWASTCFVYPAPPTPPLCGGGAACKTASIAEATSTNPLTVPAKTTLHVLWTFTIVNQATNSFDMEFAASTFPASSPNTTGLRDAFNCGESPDSSGSPGANGVYSNYQSTGFDLQIGPSNLPCNAERLILTNSGSTIVLHPGQSISFTVAMVDSGFLVRGMHCLNEGINLRWIQSDDSLVHAYHAPDVDVLVA
jgi:hypothetical protein